MSLIQDALKRQHDEMNKKAAADSPATSAPPTPATTLPSSISMPRIPLRKEASKAEAPPAPPPVEPDLHANEPESEKKNYHLVLLAAIGLCLAIGVGAFFEWPFIRGLFKASSPVSPPATTVTPKPDPAPVSSNKPPLPKPVDVVAKSNPPPPVIIVPVTPAPTSEPVRLPIVSTPPPIDPPRIVQPVSWPPIKLTGFVKLGKTSAALINGKVVAAGDTIQDVTLIKVTPEGAHVRFQGEERTLRVGETAR